MAGASSSSAASEGDDAARLYLDDGEYGLHVIRIAAQERRIPCLACYVVSEVADEGAAASMHRIGGNPIKHVAETVFLGVKNPQVMKEYLDKLERNDTDVVSWETLMGVIKSGDLAQFQRLCKNDPGLASRVGVESVGTMPIHVAATYEEALPILRWLLENGHAAEINVRSKISNRSPLDYAVNGLNPEAVALLLQYGGHCNLSFDALPPYIENLPVSETMLKNHFRVMDLLPRTTPWDERWWRLKSEMERKEQPSEPACKKEKEQESQMCVVCMKDRANTIVIPCLHKVVCKACSAQLKNDAVNKSICVYCRQPIEGIWLEDDEKIQE